jgi:hypothetical protein
MVFSSNVTAGVALITNAEMYCSAGITII